MSASPKIAVDATGTYTPLTGRAYVGATLGGKYQVTRVLGVGGMGVVCEARHVELGGRRFAVKLVQRYFAGSDIAMARFRREVRAIAAIESDHIVQVTDVGVDEKFGLYMVMEFLQGEDLAAYVHRSGQLKPIEAVKIAHQIARGLAKAHAARIIHRDLKPGNVFLTKREDGSLCVKIYDFGISKLLGDPDKTGTWNAELTGVGMPVGTPQYMSPEQAQGMELDPRTDVWSLGAVLFEMLAGQGPYPPRGRAHHTIMRVMTEDPPPIEKVAPWVPPSVARVVNMALARDRDQRIEDCGAFAELLERAMPVAFGGAVASAERTDDEVTVVSPPPRSPSSDPRLAPTAHAIHPPTPAPYTLTTPLPPRLDQPPSSHMRISPWSSAAPRKRGGRGAVGLTILGLAICAAVAIGGHAGKLARGTCRYAVAPASALAR
jgi:serine/threonine-protein kinase